MDQDKHNASQTLKVAGVVSFYMGAALVMVFVNKAVLNSSPDLPLLFLLNQLIIAVVLLHISALITPKVEIPHLDLKTAKKVAPVTLVNVIGLVFNILCLRGVEASFFQIARGLVLPLTIAVSSVQTRNLPSRRVLLAAGVVTLGFLLGVAPHTFANIQWRSAPSGLSIFYGVLSSLFIAVHAVLIKSSLPHVHNSTIQLAYWQNLGSAAFLAPFILIQGEYGRLLELTHSSEWNGSVFVWGSIVTGVFGFLLCVAGLLSIKVTSPITHMFSSAARSVIQTLLGVWLFSDLLTSNRAASILIIALGTMYYTWVRSVDSASPRPSVPPRDPVDLEKAESALAKYATETPASDGPSK
ncbi:nucleotide-sugar transporter-like protein [Phanerochaete sordida]|uniref:Nucleotide-sugar transporter-like protein n=1 Tax=Phanerochaete sordida TaxID=48140 RepID=A0A9P3L877_9APHY|nr:nucleotide-sugar transporter-like protein [Phanerochaete sordida]